MGTCEHEPSVPAVIAAQRGEQAQRKDPVLVEKVGTEAEQQALAQGLVLLLAQGDRKSRLTGGAVVETWRHDCDSLLLDECIIEQLATRMRGEDYDPLGGRHAAAACSSVFPPRVRIGEIADVAIGDEIELAEHQMLAECERERYIPGRECLLGPV